MDENMEPEPKDDEDKALLQLARLLQNAVRSGNKKGLPYEIKLWLSARLGRDI